MPRLLQIIVVTALVSLTAPAQARTATQFYLGGSDAVVGICDPEARGADERNIGYVCFSLNTGQGGADRGQRLDFTVSDDVANPVPFFWIFENAQGDCVGDPGGTDACPNSGFGCGRVANIVIPNGAVQFSAAFEGPAFGALTCLLFEPEDSVGHATVGSALLNVHA